MTDVVDRKTRSRMMSGIRGKDTSPELLIRKALFRQGFRYRLHYPGLPGRPDLVFPKYGAIVLINGCFWHGHGCHLFKWPKTRREFWRDKISGNVERDHRNLIKLHELGWRVLVVWECAIKGKQRLSGEEVVTRVAEWLRSGADDMEINGVPAD